MKKPMIENKPVLISIATLITMALFIAGSAFRAGQYETELRNQVSNIQVAHTERLDILEKNQEDLINRLNAKDVIDATIASDIRYIREALDELKNRMD